MMSVLHKEEGANLRIEILQEPGVQSFIESHAAALDHSMLSAQLSPVMRERLSKSNYVFSGIKTFHELNEAFPSLLDDNGNRKPFEQFLNDVQSIDKTYNGNYLRAEYNFVNASADMAAKWEQFQQDGDRYNLQYRTANDGKVRPEHAELHGVTLPPSDPFWSVYYPPNGWNCRCTVVQVRKAKYPTTDHDEAMERGEKALSRDKKGMFRFNPGIQGKSFPDYNPYTISRCRDCDIASKLASGVFDNELCQACQLVRKCQEGKTSVGEQQRIERNKKEYERLSHDKHYEEVLFDPQSGGLHAIHIGHNKPDGKDPIEDEGRKKELKLAEKLYRCGHSVILLDESKRKPSEIRSDGKKIQGDKYSAVDMILDGVKMDIYSPAFGKKHYGSPIAKKNDHQYTKYNSRRDIHQQADTICIYLDNPNWYSNDRMRRTINEVKKQVKSELVIKHIVCAVNYPGEGIVLKYYDL